MIALSLLAAWAAAALVYSASPHQRLWSGRPAPPWLLRLAAFVCLGGSVGLAEHDVGAWPGAFVAVNAAMLAGVSLPALSVWLRRRHVG